MMSIKNISGHSSGSNEEEVTKPGMTPKQKKKGNLKKREQIHIEEDKIPTPFRVNFLKNSDEIPHRRQSLTEKPSSERKNSLRMEDTETKLGNIQKRYSV